MIRSLNVPLRPRTPPLFPPVLCDDTVEVLGPCRPARHTLWVIMTRLVAQHGAFAGVFVRAVCRGSSQRVITWRFRAVWRADAASPCSESPSNSPIIPSRAKGRSWSCSVESAIKSEPNTRRRIRPRTVHALPGAFHVRPGQRTGFARRRHRPRRIRSRGLLGRKVGGGDVAWSVRDGVTLLGPLRTVYRSRRYGVT